MNAGIIKEDIIGSDLTAEKVPLGNTDEISSDKVSYHGIIILSIIVYSKIRKMNSFGEGFLGGKKSKLMVG